MRRRTAVSALLVALTFTLAAWAQSGTAIGWYNGDWKSGIPSHPNWYLSADEFARVYDQFQVPEGGWTVVAVFGHNVGEGANIGSVSWEIRRGMTSGVPGEVVASGISPAVQSPDASITSPPYIPDALPLLVKMHFRIQANYLNVHLAAGNYWLSVTPVGVKNTFANATLGANAVGVGPGGPRPALVDRTTGPRFAIAESVGGTGQVGRGRFFSQGVIIAK
jgi:hypothetical protein